MDKKAFQEDLRTLAQGKNERRSNTALISDVMDDIEAALARGIKRETILQALQKQGVTLTPQGFQSALRELRKKRKAKQATINQPKGAAPSPKPEAKPSAALQTPTKAPSPPKTEEDEEDKAIEEFKKSIAHLPAVQQGRKMGDFLEKLQENKMSPFTRRWLEKESKAAEANPTPEETPKPLNIPGYKSKLTDKDREEYQALKEAIKDLPDREQRKRMEQFWSQRG